MQTASNVYVCIVSQKFQQKTPYRQKFQWDCRYLENYFDAGAIFFSRLFEYVFGVGRGGSISIKWIDWLSAWAISSYFSMVYSSYLCVGGERKNWALCKHARRTMSPTPCISMKHDDTTFLWPTCILYLVMIFFDTSCSTISFWK